MYISIGGMAYWGRGESIKVLAGYKRAFELISAPEAIEAVNKKISGLTEEVK